MSDIHETRPPSPGKQPGYSPKLHKHTLKPVHNGHRQEPLAPHLSAPLDIADSETIKLSTHIPGVGADSSRPPGVGADSRPSQNGASAASSRPPGVGADSRPSQNGASAASSNGHHAIEQAETFKMAATVSAASTPHARPTLSHRLLITVAYPLRQLIRLRRYSRPLFAAALLVPLIVLLAAGSLEYIQLQQPYDDLSVVNSLTGAVQWRQPLTSPMQALAVDGQGSLVALATGPRNQQLVALSPSGAVQWRSLTTPYTFSVPAVSTLPGSVLITMGKPLAVSTARGQRPLILAQLRRATGTIVWQRTMVSPTNQASAAVLGEDQRFVYVAVVQTGIGAGLPRPGVALQAISQNTGTLAWTVIGPNSANDAGGDVGKLLVQGSDLFWQDAGNIYAIDPTSGKVAWQRFIPENDATALPAEESHMVVTGNIVIVERGFAYHALNIATGTDLWTIANPGLEFGAQPSVSGITAAGSTIFLYGGGEIEAVDVATRQVLWDQKQLDSIQRVIISHDGSLLYTVLTDSIEGGQPAQALVALDVHNGGARWTFQPSGQTAFLPLLPGGIVYTPHAMLAAVCLSPQTACTQPFLYALDPANGSVLWRTGGKSIGGISISPDGGIVIFQQRSTGWLDLMDRFHNS